MNDQFVLQDVTFNYRFGKRVLRLNILIDLHTAITIALILPFVNAGRVDSRTVAQARDRERVEHTSRARTQQKLYTRETNCEW